MPCNPHAHRRWSGGSASCWTWPWTRSCCRRRAGRTACRAAVCGPRRPHPLRSPTSRWGLLHGVLHARLFGTFDVLESVRGGGSLWQRSPTSRWGLLHGMKVLGVVMGLHVQKNGGLQWLRLRRVCARVPLSCPIPWTLLTILHLPSHAGVRHPRQHAAPRGHTLCSEGGPLRRPC